MNRLEKESVSADTDCKTSPRLGHSYLVFYHYDSAARRRNETTDEMSPFSKSFPVLISYSTPFPLLVLVQVKYLVSY